MNNKNIFSLLFLMFALFASLPSQASITSDKYSHPFYVGMMGGWGSTTWSGLVPKDPNAALNLSVPTGSDEGGSAWGLFVGSEIIPQFAVEASYMHYPNATLTFDPMSLFTFDHGIQQMTTRTERVAVTGRFLVEIPHVNGLRAYATAGAGEIHRSDDVMDTWRLSPVFGAGISYVVTPHAMLELGTEYVAGYGQSELDPAEHFIPFLYSAFARLAYRFG